MHFLQCARTLLTPIFMGMNTPDYPALSAKLTQQSQSMCAKCGLTIMRPTNQSKPCLEDCPARAMLRNAEKILSDYIPS